MEKFTYIPRDKLSELPKEAGVYVFSSNKAQDKQVLYIGKAGNIRERVKNHFQQPSFRDNLFINQVIKIGYFKTYSEIKALILEAELIKKYQPKYNVIWKDNKNYFFVEITKEDFPRVFITHQPIKKSPGGAKYVGPFVEGTSLKRALTYLRRAFPFYTAKKHPKGSCLWCGLNLCPGPDPDKKEYRKNINNLVRVLEGKSQKVLRGLKKEMEKEAKEENFEKAAGIRNRVWALERVLSHARVFEAPLSENNWQEIQGIIKKIFGIKKDVLRMEAYDISNIQGKEATGSMVHFKNGFPDKNFYRKFKIKIQGKPNDTAMLKEVLKRRLKHEEWPYPELILIDGGKGQLNSAKEALKEENIEIPLISLAKRRNEIFSQNKKKPILAKTLPREIFNLILFIRDEAHRFAISYHKNLRKKVLF